MPDWATVLLSITLSTLTSLLIAHLVHERMWRRRLSRILAALKTHRDLKRATAKLGRRPRRRYIVFEVLTEGEPSGDDVEAAIKSVVREYLGVTGLASSGVDLVYYEESRKRGVLRVTNEYRYQIIGLLGLVRSISGRRALLIPLAVTGSIKRARRLLG